MITAEFYLQEEKLIGFSVRGHAGFADLGRDIACASVTSAVEMAANRITEILKIPAAVELFENEVKLLLPQSGKEPGESSREGFAFIQALRLHLELLAREFPENIRIIDLEV